MQAIDSDEPGGPEVLVIRDLEDPVPGPGELLVDVHAAGVNRADLLQRMGRYPPPPGASPILGLELAGKVRLLGTGVTGFSVGDRVMSLVTGGGYASRAVVSPDTTLPVPESLDWAQAAAIPEAFLTAWLNLFDLGRLEAGESVLIHAGASGVGSAAIQLAKSACTTVFTLVGSEQKAAFCKKLGADTVINRHDEQFDARILDITDGVDLVLDFVGAPTWDANLRVLRRGGRLALIGFLGGPRGTLDLSPVLRKSLNVFGTGLRGTRPEQKKRLVESFGRFALPRFADGRLLPLVDRTFPLAEAPAAHAYMAENKNAGKIILTTR